MSEIYTASIRETRWIDLSDKHETARKNLEDAIRLWCIEGKDVNPIQINGAFRIGKSQLLYYLFHYAWSELKIPAFFIRLETVVEIVRSAITGNEGKIGKDAVTAILNDHFQKQINHLTTALKNKTSKKKFDLPDIRSNQSVGDYFNNLGSGGYITKTGETKSFAPITADSALQVVSRTPRYLILVDEFEEAYHKINEIVESAGGGPLRQFFEDVSKHHTNFFLVIACGPAAGFKIKSGMTQGSISAQTGRIQNIQVPFPDVGSLQKTFLKGCDKGYANFIWWLSRRRPGWMKKLVDEIQADADPGISYDTFIQHNKTTFDNPIDSSGKAEVRVLKYSVFPDKFENSGFLDHAKNMLVSLQPRLVSNPEAMTEFIESSRHETYFSESLVSYTDLLDAMVADLKKNYTETVPDQEYDAGNLIRIYLGHILSSVSDHQSRIAIGFATDEDKRKRTVDTFLLPVLSLLYDFIAEYEDETEEEIRHLLNFIYDLAYSLEKDSGHYQVFKKTGKLIRSFDPADLDQAWMQLNFRLLREIIQPPVGSPEISYQGEPLAEHFNHIPRWNFCSFVWDTLEDESIRCRFFLVPDISWIDAYLEQLKTHIRKQWESKFLPGHTVHVIVFLSPSDSTEKFKVWLENEAGNHSGVCRQVNKVVVMDAEEISDELSTHIGVFLNSLCKIALIEGKRLINSEAEVPIDTIVDRVQQADWPIRKEERRTIAYFWERSQNALAFLAEKCVSKYRRSMEEHLGMNLEELGKSLTSRIHFPLPEHEAASVAALLILSLAEEESGKGYCRILVDLYRTNLLFDSEIPELAFIRQLAFWVEAEKKNIVAKRNPMRSSVVEKLIDFSKLFDDTEDFDTAQATALENMILPLIPPDNEKTAGILLRAVYCRAKCPQWDLQETIGTLNQGKQQITARKTRLENSNHKMMGLFHRNGENDSEILDLNHVAFFQNRILIPLSREMEKNHSNVETELYWVLLHHVNLVSKSYEARLDAILKSIDALISTLDGLKTEMDTRHRAFAENYEDKLHQRLFLSQSGNPPKLECEDFYRGIVLRSFKASEVYQQHFKQTVTIDSVTAVQDIAQKVISFLTEKKPAYWEKIQQHETTMDEISSRLSLIHQVCGGIDNLLAIAEVQ